MTTWGQATKGSEKAFENACSIVRILPAQLTMEHEGSCPRLIP
jgi:hypothetical protein